MHGPWPGSLRALPFKKYCRIIRLCPRSMSALSLLLPLLPLKRIYPSGACPLLSESKYRRGLEALNRALHQALGKTLGSFSMALA